MTDAIPAEDNGQWAISRELATVATIASLALLAAAAFHFVGRF